LIRIKKKYSIHGLQFQIVFLIIAAMAMGTVIIVSVDETKLTKQLIGAGGVYTGNDNSITHRL